MKIAKAESGCVPAKKGATFSAKRMLYLDPRVTMPILAAAALSGERGGWKWIVGRTLRGMVLTT